MPPPSVQPEHLRPRTITKAQRSVLRHMKAWEGQATIFDRHRKTVCGKLTNDVHTNVCVLDALLTNGLIETVTGSPSKRLYRLTEYAERRFRL